MTVFEGKRALLDAFRRGDRAALTDIYARSVHEVAMLVRNGFSVGTEGGVVPGVREPQRQLDLIQEVFLRAFSEKARLSYDGLSPFRPWLMRIAKNLVIDEARRSGRLVALDGPEAIAEGGARLDMGTILPVAPEEELEWKNLREATKAWCAALDPALQRFVGLRFEEERSQADVAETLGVTRRRVRTMEAWVRAELRRHLKSRGLGGH